MKNNQKPNKSTGKKNINLSYGILYIIVLFIVFIFSVISHYVFKTSWYDLIDSTVGNLVGILAAFLLFDFFNDKLTKDSYSDEINENIYKAIVSSPDILKNFSQERRNEIISSAVQASVKNYTYASMVTANISNLLLEDDFNHIKTSFDYKFELDSQISIDFDWLSNSEIYYSVREILSYTVMPLNNSFHLLSPISIGLLFDNQHLDNAMRGNDDDFRSCLFKENLDLDDVDIEYLKDLAESDKIKFENLVKKSFKFDVHLDKYKGEISSIKMKESGILIDFLIDADNKPDSSSIRIIFSMPKLYGTLIQALISAPTKAPNITVSYPKDYMDVEMYPFFSKGDESSCEFASETGNGVYDIHLTEEWIYPISGLVFLVNKN